MNGGSLPDALQADQYAVPTTQQDDTRTFEWRLLDTIRTQYTAPVKVGTDQEPDIDAYSAVIMDVNTQRVLWQKNPDQVVPIASITKLMTALVFLDNLPGAGLEHVHTFAPEEDTPGGKELNLDYGQQLRAFDLLRTALVASDNDTALALAHATELPQSTFVELMNRKAQSLGMTHAYFADPTGLSQHNTATPLEVAKMAREAFSKEAIRVPAGMTQHSEETVDGGQLVRVNTTNKLLYDEEVDIVAGKTGFTYEAGYCLVVQGRDPDTGREVIVLVLGADTDQARFDEVKKLLLWTFEQYDWQE